MERMERNNMVKGNNEIEIDLLELLQALKQRLWLILLAFIVGGGAAGTYSKLILTDRKSVV